MLKKILLTIIIILISAFIVPVSFAQTVTPKPTALPKAPPTPIASYATAKVVNILSQGTKTIDGQKHPFQKLQLQILEIGRAHV